MVLTDAWLSAPLPHPRKHSASLVPMLQVRGLDFNRLSPNLLASGGADGDLCIWDVANPGQPNLYPAMQVRLHGCLWRICFFLGRFLVMATSVSSSSFLVQGGPPGSQPEITHLAWNGKVQHILATATGSGTVVVWDLKKQRPVISFKDPSGWVPRLLHVQQLGRDIAP
jgi:protein transport protein SEC31